MSQIIPFQPEFSQYIPEVIGNKDYRVFRETLERIDELLEDSEIEHDLIQQIVKEKEPCGNYQGKSFWQLSWKRQSKIVLKIRQGFRCAIVRHLTGESYRRFSCRLAESGLLQKFCLISHIDRIKVPSKSKLQRNEQQFTEELIRKALTQLNQKASDSCGHPLKLTKPVDMKDYYIDTTCVNANIHFPIDWVLLRDATRTLMKATAIIRREGLKNRMDQLPEAFVRPMNESSVNGGY